jgi:hypothetical protein
MAIDFEQEEDGREKIPYDEAVEEARNIVSSMMKDHQMELGRIASRLEPKYGDQTLEHFAKEIKIDYGTLKSCRTAYNAWKDIPVRPKSFSVAKVLNRHPNRADIIQETPDITVAEAEKKMLEWKKERGASRTRRAPSKIRIIQKINELLSETSDLTGMIWEITDIPDIDPSDLEDIKEALREAIFRINRMIEIAFPKSEPDIVMDQSKEKSGAAV